MFYDKANSSPIMEEGFFVFFLFFAFLRPHLWHMEVPRLGVEIRATAASLHYSHSNTGSKSRLRPTPHI